MTKVIVIGGNIGSGKTTAGRAVAETLGACFVPEPVEEWVQSGKLAAFYRDPSKGYDFQTYAMQTRVQALNARLVQWRHAHDGEMPDVIVLDRWLADDMMFGKVTHQRGGMTDAEFVQYCKEHSDLVRSVQKCGFLKEPHTVWLGATPETCLARLNERGRQEEQTIDLAYLRDLDGAKPKVSHTLPTDALGADEVAAALAEHIRAQLSS